MVESPVLRPRDSNQNYKQLEFFFLIFEKVDQNDAKQLWFIFAVSVQLDNQL